MIYSREHLRHKHEHICIDTSGKRRAFIGKGYDLQRGVEKERIAKAFPYGKVEVKVVGGGLRWHSGIVAPKLGQCSGLQFCSALAQWLSKFAPNSTSFLFCCSPVSVLAMVMLLDNGARPEQCCLHMSVQQCCATPAAVVSSIIPAQYV